MGKSFDVSDKELAEQLKRLRLQNAQKEIEISRIK